MLTKDIDWGGLPAETPANARRLLALCVVRERRERLQSLGDIGLVLDAPVSSPARPARLGLIAAGLMTAAAAMALWAPWRGTTNVGGAPLMRLDVDIAHDLSADTAFGSNIVLSRDGTRIAHVVRGADGLTRLSTRRLSDPQLAVLAGSEGAVTPFFSPSGEWIGFSSNGRLQKIASVGGAALTICDAPAFRGGSWGDDGQIVAALAGGSGLSKVSSDGGSPSALTRLESAATHRWPQVLPGAKAAIFTSSPLRGDYRLASIESVDLAPGARKVLIERGHSARYMTGGYLLFLRDETLYAVSFDADKIAVGGAAAMVLENVAFSLLSGGAQFDTSPPGLLIYRGRDAAGLGKLEWLIAGGLVESFLNAPLNIRELRISPDGGRIAFEVLEAGGSNVIPVWTPDGEHLIYQWGRELGTVRADGSGGARRLTEDRPSAYPTSVSPDGKTLLYFESNINSGFDIMMAKIEKDANGTIHLRDREPWLRTQSNVVSASFSPNGKWVTYLSDESGQNEVQVRPFAKGAAGKWTVSSGGGEAPVWSPAARELFYLSKSGRIMAASFSLNGDALEFSRPKEWSSRRLSTESSLSVFTVAPDGKQIAALTAPEGEGGQTPPRRVTFLVNFADEVKRKLTAAGAGR